MSEGEEREEIRHYREAARWLRAEAERAFGWGMTLRAVDLLANAEAIERAIEMLAADAPASGTIIVERPYARLMKTAGNYIESARKALELASHNGTEPKLVQKELDVAEGYLELAAVAPGGRAVALDLAELWAEIERLRKANSSGP